MLDRVDELHALAAAEGLRLPMPAEAIAKLEDMGHVVDLVTGQIDFGGANRRVQLTVIGEAVAVVERCLRQ